VHVLADERELDQQHDDNHDNDRHVVHHGKLRRRFSDGTQTEMATLTGDTTSGYTATLTVGVSV
jgi:hypothetical protein